jgi:hypothetical protein
MLIQILAVAFNALTYLTNFYFNNAVSISDYTVSDVGMISVRWIEKDVNEVEIISFVINLLTSFITGVTDPFMMSGQAIITNRRVQQMHGKHSLPWRAHNSQVCQKIPQLY